MRITREQKEVFDTLGYFVIDQLFTIDEMDELTNAIQIYVDRHHEELTDLGTQGISRVGEIQFTAHLAAQDERIKRFVTQDRLVQIAIDIIGPNVRLYWDQAVVKRPETPREFPWHQDNGYTPVDPEQYLTCWLALTDATLENGCIWVLPGSHKQGTLRHEDSPLGKVAYSGENPGVPVPLRKGGVAVFSSLLLHKSGPNLTTADMRKAYIVQYCDAAATLRKTGSPLTDRLLVAGE